MSADKPIPDVIIRAAADFCRARGVSPMDTPFHPTPAVLAVIDAIMARDERAAKIAEQAGNTFSNSRDMMQAVQEAAVDAKCIEVAAAIRNGA